MSTKQAPHGHSKTSPPSCRKCHWRRLGGKPHLSEPMAPPAQGGRCFSRKATLPRDPGTAAYAAAQIIAKAKIAGFDYLLARGARL